MTAPIGKIGSQQRVTRDNGSDGHAAVAKQQDALVASKLDGSAGARAASSAGSPPRNEKVMQVAKMYERQFLGEMFKAMRSTVSETDKPSMAQEIYNSQRDDQYVDAWSENGGLGFSNVIYDQIMERFFGGTQAGQQLRAQGPIALVNRDIKTVSQIKSGVATPLAPPSLATTVTAATTAAAAASAPIVPNAEANLRAAAGFAPNASPTADDARPTAREAQTVAGEARTVENTEPMPAPTPPKIDTRSTEERIAAKEYFPASATEKPKASAATESAALQIEVRPSPTGAPAKIQAPWDATVLGATKLPTGQTAVTLEHGQGLRSTLVFDGVLSSVATPGQKIPRGQVVGTLNQDAKSFVWNLAPQSAVQSAAQSN